MKTSFARSLLRKVEHALYIFVKSNNLVLAPNEPGAEGKSTENLLYLLTGYITDSDNHKPLAAGFHLLSPHQNVKYTMNIMFEKSSP